MKKIPSGKTQMNAMELTPKDSGLFSPRVGNPLLAR